jgi:hypothetical protein
MADWCVLSGVLNRVNNSMGRGDLYPFTIHRTLSRRSVSSTVSLLRLQPNTLR